MKCLSDFCELFLYRLWWWQVEATGQTVNRDQNRPAGHRRKQSLWLFANYVMRKRRLIWAPPSGERETEQESKNGQRMSHKFVKLPTISCGRFTFDLSFVFVWSHVWHPREKEGCSSSEMRNWRLKDWIVLMLLWFPGKENTCRIFFVSMFACLRVKKKQNAIG